MPESLRLAPSSQPALTEGRYRVTVTQTASIDCTIAPASLEFWVSTEQLRLGPDEVYSTYPPAMSAGLFGDCLPHIILKRKTLPWERKLAGLPEDAPWMALLVFSEEEGVGSRSLSYREAAAGRDGLYIPRLQRNWADGDEACVAIDIPRQLFAEVLPLAGELPLLAHSRQVSLDNKVTDATVQEGWFSCVVANRYPDQPKEQAGEYKKHSAHLVSLEGFEDYLTGDRSTHPLNACDTVRMFSLASWSFSVQKEPFDFAALAGKLRAAPFGAEAGEGWEKIASLVDLGYCPVEHQFREGSVSVSWYRSPLLPQKSAEEKLPLCRFADQLLRYDPETGMFDISLSAAWQLGRLLCLQKKDLPGQIMRWRQRNRELAIRRSNGQALSGQLPAKGAAAALRAYSEETVRQRCNEEWAGLLASLTAAIGLDE